MAKLYISEHASLAQNGTAQVVVQPPLAVQVVDFSGGVALSAAFNAQTNIIRVHTDAVCSIRFDGSSATTSYPRMSAGQTEYFGVQPRSKVSAISNT